MLDGENDTEDWIEIHNRGTDSVNLQDWHLTDDADDLTRWQFPDHTLNGGESLVVFASGKHPNGPAGELHTDFKLSSNGEYLALVQPDGETIESEFTPEFPPQYSDISYGWSSDFTEQGYFTDPTPGNPNLADPIPDPTVQVMITEIMYHPASENVLDEYIELTNRGYEPVELAGFQLTAGVQYTFEAQTLNPGESLAVAADLATFQANYPDVTNVVGGWNGRLSNASETIELVDATGLRVDRVTYADQGDWTFREEGPLDHQHTGWLWNNLHDGGGRSLEMINTALSNNYGQNWAASLVDGGTPGSANSVAATDIAPMVLDVTHSPAIPTSADPVTVAARLRDELSTGLGASVFFRTDGDPSFLSAPMFDDGLHGDGEANDGVFGAILPAAADGTVVEFYVQATDSSINLRTWPAPVEPSGEQLANLLYQVDDSFDAMADWTPGSPPIYRIIMTEAERAELADIGDDGDAFTGEARSNAQMNATFISVDGVDTKVRYEVGVRNRGNRSRVGSPNNYRVNFRNDDPWKGVTALNINADTPTDQILGSALYRMAGNAAPQTSAIEVRVNGQEITGIYAGVEVYDTDWAEHHFPDDPAGNVYRLRYFVPTSGPRTYADLDYKGTPPYNNPDDYRNNYGKQTNASEDDWTDLFDLIDTLNNPAISDVAFVAEVSQIIDLRQWMRYMATDFLAGNGEGGLLSGDGDDAAMYCGIEDRRFRLL
ncbi:MAG TPA: lamin tail domain-containing protein, partial [Thermoguttaceae bacterium]|nr:lamin tail domain-containing protein [Thermoguttaceae bacterium]